MQDTRKEFYSPILLSLLITLHSDFDSFVKFSFLYILRIDAITFKSRYSGK